jgi:hypothetical protein
MGRRIGPQTHTQTNLQSFFKGSKLGLLEVILKKEEFAQHFGSNSFLTHY